MVVSESTGKSLIIVPARLRSKRFPRKLLHEIHGKPLILWTASRLASVTPGLPFYFAVEDEELEDVLLDAGYNVFRTQGDHLTGTDRIAEANVTLQAEYVLNVQADEPLVTADQLILLDGLIRGGADMATLAFPLISEADFMNPNCVKVVLDHKGHALYFSRAPIPFPRGVASPISKEWFLQNACFHHMGVYAYRQSFLKEFSNLNPGSIERVESLEQLRALEHGFQISVGISNQPTVWLDTPEDARRLEELLA